MVIGTINTSATSGNAGNVVAIANNGNVLVTNIDATSTGTGTGGNVKIIASGNIATGTISTYGNGGAGYISITTGTPSLPSGTGFQIQGGAIVAGESSITTSALTNGTVNINGELFGLELPVSVITGSAGSISYAGLGIQGQNLTFATGALNFSQLNSLTASFDSGFNGGIINIAASSVTTSGGPLHLDVRAANFGLGGTINVTMNTASTLNLDNTTGQFFFDIGNLSSLLGSGGSLNFTNIGSGNIVLGAGAVTGFALGNSSNVKIVAEGDITVATASAFNLSGADGKGAVIELNAGADGFGTLALGSNIGFFNQANGTGANGDGGGLIFTGSNITTTAGSSSGSPLVLTAQGTGNGDGGTIVYRTNSTVPIFVGAPAKAPKAPFFFIEANASAGSGGSGDGGSLEITTGGALTINNPGLALAARGTTGTNGANYTFRAGTTATGALVINGNLDATGATGINGGVVTLASNIKDSFSINKSGAKNGIAGTINTGDGEINVTNNGGGILVQTSAGVVGDEMHFTVGTSKGSFTTGTGVTINAADELTFTANGGSIGGKALININTALLQANTSGKGAVGFNSLFNGAMTLLNSTSGANFTLVTAGSATVNDIVTAAKGSILVRTDAGNLSVAAGATLTANSGALTLQNTNTASGQNPDRAGVQLKRKQKVKTQH